MKVSIIIPVYNVEPYIEDCIKSVIGQTMSDGVECIIVDDCTKDNSMTILQQIINNYFGPISFRILHHDENKGLSCARNTGLLAATGDYIYFLDSDDMIPPYCIETLYAPIANDDTLEMVIGNFQKIGLEQTIGTISQLGTITEGVDAYFYNDLTTAYAWNKLVSRELILKNNILFVPHLICEDIIWTRELALTLSKIYITDKITYLYRIRETSITTSSSTPWPQVFLEVKIQLLRNLFRNYRQNNIHAYYFVTWGLAEGIVNNDIRLDKPDMHDTFYAEFRRSPYWSIREQLRLGVKPYYIFLSLNRKMPMPIGRFYVKILYHLSKWYLKYNNSKADSQ